MDQQNDQRRLHRHPISGRVSAFSRDTEKQIGKLVNVHREGLLLESVGPLVPEQVYPLKLTMDGEVTMPWIGLDAKCLWVAEIEGVYRAGCMIVSIEREALEVLRQLDL